MVQFRVDNSALLKVLLHGAKFSTSSINGLLIGRSEGDNMHIVDAIPLFHTALSLAPSLELALALVEDRLRDSEDGIVGLYVSDAHISKDDFDLTSKAIANKLAALNSSPFTLTLILENETLGQMMKDEDVLPFKLYRRVSGSSMEDWVSCSNSDFLATNGANLKTLFASLLDRDTHKSLHDFDEHLDNIHTCHPHPFLASSLGL